MFSVPFFRKKVSAKVLAYIGNLDNGANSTVYTFTAAAIGTPSADRRVHILIYGGGGGGASTISAVTVDGIAATINVQSANPVDEYSICGIATAAVPNGATANIVVTFGSSRGRANIGVYASTGLASQAAHDTGVSAADPATDTLNTQAGGFALGLAGNGNNSGTFTWTNMTENYDVHPESGQASVSGASEATTGGALTITADFSGTASDKAAAFATF